jgi:hypothetical protein
MPNNHDDFLNNEDFLLGVQADVCFSYPLMYLYLGNNPRSLYLVTSSHDERLGRPKRALVFRLGEGQAKAIVEFLHHDQINTSDFVKLTSRVVKGCIGLISVDNGG